MVKGISKAIKESKAKKIYVCNIMTEPGLTDNYSVSDHINSIISHCGEGLMDYCLYDTGEIIPEIIKRYNKDGSDLVDQDIKSVKDKKIKFIKKDLSVISENCIRHNATIIADIVIQMICDDFKYLDKQNEPEYLLMNTKLKADKEISKKQKKYLKKQKRNKNGKTKRIKSKSKFASKYDDRIKSIRESEQNIKRKKKSNQSKDDDKEKIEDYDKVRKQMLKKFNNTIKK